MNQNVLILDCDGVIFDSLPLIDEYVQKINYEASDAYSDELDFEELKIRAMLHKYEKERSNNPEEMGLIQKRLNSIEKRRDKHYDYKDLVLEEVIPEYQNRIDYDDIYQLENTFDGVINMIYTIYGKGLFNEIYVLSHVNCDREIDAKKRFFKKYLPMIKFVPVKFHLESFYNEKGEKNVKRLRTNKVEYFRNYTGIGDLSNSYFIDDTESIINEARKIGVAGAYYKNGSLKTVDLLTKVSFEVIGVVDYLNIRK